MWLLMVMKVSQEHLKIDHYLESDPHRFLEGALIASYIY